MISTARELAAEKQAAGGPVVRFEVSTAEDISPELIPDGSVDLITAATCAHVSLSRNPLAPPPSGPPPLAFEFKIGARMSLKRPFQE